MNDETHDRRGSRRTPAAAKVVVVTVVVLAALLGACSSSDPAASPSAAPGTTTTPATTDTTTVPTTTIPPTTTEPPTTTTTIHIVTEGAVVLVANASGIDGAAGQVSAALQGVGFLVIDPTNAAGNEQKLDVSKVYFLPLGEAAARSIAELMGGVSVSKMPVPAWINGGTEALGYTTVLVMLGSDLAGSQLPGLVGR